AEGQEPHALPGLRLTPTRIRLPLALLIAALSGASLSLALPPAALGPLSFIALIPLLWLVQGARPRRGLFLGLAFGAGYFGTVLYWILLFGEMAWAALTFTSAAFVGVFGLLAPAVWRGERPVRSAVGLAALWTALEYLRGMWPLGGFTWGGLGYTQVDNRLLLPLAAATGVWGLTFVVALVDALLLLALERGWARPRAAVAYVAAAAVLVLAPALIRVPAANGRTLDVAALQVDVRSARGLPSLEEDRAVAKMNIELHDRLASDPPDLAVWGESALDPGANLPDFRPLVSEAIRDVGAPTLAGAVEQTPDGTTYAESLLFDGSGRVVDRYRKVHLVPFGEYVPFRRYLGWISALQQIPYDITPGERLDTLNVDGITFGNVICFENSFAAIDRTLVAGGAGFLIVTTNNASYEFTAASRQHLVMSRLRAVENGRWVVHAAVSGISAFIDPTGGVVAETGLFEPAIIRHTIRASTALTLYTRFGDWVPWLSLLLSAGLLLLPRRRTGPGVRPVPLPETPRTLVILPTYNERATIEEVVGGLLALPERVDVLVVDDGSPDGTASAVRAIAASEPRVRLFERPAKAGLASAYLIGFRRGIEEGYDVMVEMDSDLSHQPAELPGLLTAAGDRDLVIGSRYVPGGAVTNWTRARRALSRGGNLYARLALGFPLRDATSGFRVFRRPLLQSIVRDPVHSDGYGFQIELALRAYLRGFSIAEVPITFRERQHGHSKISRRIVLEALWLVTLWGVRARLGGSSRALPNPP
ncbi:MAG: apolipoprotein N-acyltransferase, partial [Actinobacteria bacterium]|nr:apolipoprotein N-acyltransferase [Actinomycetota bacterium]